MEDNFKKAAKRDNMAGYYFIFEIFEVDRLLSKS